MLDIASSDIVAGSCSSGSGSQFSSSGVGGLGTASDLAGGGTAIDAGGAVVAMGRPSCGVLGGDGC